MPDAPNPPAASEAIAVPLTVRSPQQDEQYSATACESSSLVAPANAIARGVSSLATHITREQAFGHRLGILLGKVFFVGVPLGVGALFGVEQFLASQQESARNQAEVQFSAVAEQLEASQPALQAAAVRALPRLAKIRDIPRPEPSEYYIGANLVNRFVRSQVEYPLGQRCWTLFREFARQPRKSTIPLIAEDIVSSSLLVEGGAWEIGRREGDVPSEIEASGTLLYKAYLPKAQGIELDFHRINFGSVDLTEANLSGSDFSECGFTGARMGGAILRGTNFKSAYVTEANMDEADLSFARLEDATFTASSLSRTRFSQTSLAKADFTGAILDGAVFRQATARQVIFRNASLKHAVFDQTDVSGAVFEGADIEGADFRHAVGLSNGQLRGARNGNHALFASDQLSKGGK